MGRYEPGIRADLGGSVGLWVGLLDGKHPESRVQFVRTEMPGRTQGRKIAHRVGEENATQ